MLQVFRRRTRGSRRRAASSTRGLAGVRGGGAGAEASPPASPNPEPLGKCKCKKARDCGDVPGNVVGWRAFHMCEGESSSPVAEILAIPTAPSPLASLANPSHISCCRRVITATPRRPRAPSRCPKRCAKVEATRCASCATCRPTRSTSTRCHYPQPGGEGTPRRKTSSWCVLRNCRGPPSSPTLFSRLPLPWLSHCSPPSSARRPR